MIKIGITGGIGSGKSYVSHLLEEAGIPVYDTDTEAKKLTLSHPRIREGLLVLLGEDVYKADGSLNKPVLASYLFASTENAGRVNRIIHPCVYEDFQQWADRQAASGTEVVAMESAILFESGFHTAVDYVVMVYAPLELRITRAMQRDAATEAQIRHVFLHRWMTKKRSVGQTMSFSTTKNYSWIRRLRRWKSGLLTEKRADSLCMSFVRCIFVTRN